MDPISAAATVAMNAASGALGSMIITSLAGVLAKDGNWIRSYLLCLPAAVIAIPIMRKAKD